MDGTDKTLLLEGTPSNTALNIEGHTYDICNITLDGRLIYTEIIGGNFNNKLYEMDLKNRQIRCIREAKEGFNIHCLGITEDYIIVYEGDSGFYRDNPLLCLDLVSNIVFELN